MVGAQWLFVNDPNAATIVALVQTANSLPIMLLALPAGVVADAFDRRWLLFGVQVYFFAVSALLAVLALLGQLAPPLMLAFTFAIGVGMALQLPTWAPLISELVPRAELPAATRLDMVSVNVARAAGPALAGVIIGVAGVGWVFAFNAACTLLLIGVLLAWRRPRQIMENRDRFLPALLTGGRYVRHEPVVRVIVGRLACFVGPGVALWALLPIIARQQLGLQAGGYGLLFAALGVGALVGALTVGGLRARLSSNAVVIVMSLVYAAALAATMVAPGLAGAVPLLVIAGYAWVGVASTLIGDLQLFLPGWVRARALAVYLMTFMGLQSVAAPVWGVATQGWGLRPAVLLAAALTAVLSAAGLAWRLPDTAHADPAPVAYWGDARVLVEPEPDAGAIGVEIEYHVPPENEAAFFEAMVDLRRSRLRSGSARWELYRVGERPDRFVETYIVSSWAEHLRQHAGRMTADDERIEKAAQAFAIGMPTARHLLPPDSAARLSDELS